ncbi:MAG: polymerase, sigma-24 subunit, subfamily [Acidobacteriaceae bacterium]|nr:polymerase, sigma-24 subunit, subfamily [Acidobacteriaceae bacterium]
MSPDSAHVITLSLAEDAELVLASKAGDIAAFDQLVTRYNCKLLRIAQHITHNFDDAQDAVQETFLKAFQKLGEFRGDSKFSTWLFRIAVNQSLMGLRKQRTKQRAGAEFPINIDEEGRLPIDFSDWRPNPEEMYKTSELRELLTIALQELRPALRVVFVLHDVEGHTLRETAEALDLTLAAVKTRSLRARLILRERLSTYFKIEMSGKTKAGPESAVNCWQSPPNLVRAATAAI